MQTKQKTETKHHNTHKKTKTNKTTDIQSV